MTAAVPVEPLEFRIGRPAVDVVAALREQTTPTMGTFGIFFRRQDKLLAGCVSADCLKVRLNRLSASSSRPMFCASISEIEGFTLVKGHLYLNSIPFVLAIFAIGVMATGPIAVAGIVGVGFVTVGVVSYRRERQALVFTLERLFNGSSAE